MTPTPLEIEFNDHLMKITDILSGAKLKNISILDLSAFGSRLVSLRKDQKRYPNWFTETNFAILQKVTGHSNPTPCWSVFEFWKIKLENSNLKNWIFSLQKSILKLIFADYTGSKNSVSNRLKIQFIKLDYFSNWIFQKSSTDQQGLFNPNLQSQTSQPQTFQAQTPILGWTGHGWKVWGCPEPESLFISCASRNFFGTDIEI